MTIQIDHYLNLAGDEIISHLRHGDVSQTIRHASQYSIEAGGKRFRPQLLFSALSGFNVDLALGVKTAGAIEMIHTYSLIHDDLPAMDDDDLRRGNPTNHKVFGEATAILAGDNLLTESFNLVANDDRLSADTRLKLVQIISLYAGHNGMIGGQMLDIEAENKDISLTELENIHRHKTGRLIIAPVHAACLIAGAGEADTDRLINFAGLLGIIFQISDDLLDVIGDVKVTGKNTGSDVRKDKVTYVSVYGLDGAKDILKEKEMEASRLLGEIHDGYDTTALEEILNKFALRDQ